jgi:hAT family C-terminal dimerisation region
MVDGGYFDIIAFLTFNMKAFPFIYKLACCLASLRTNEVGCERFFSIAGYVSNPRRARLKVKHYETIAMLKRNMQQVYIDEGFVLREYMEMEKNKSWDKDQTVSDEVVTNFESKAYAEDLGLVVGELPSEFIDGVPDDDVISISDSDSDSDDSD